MLRGIRASEFGRVIRNADLRSGSMIPDYFPQTRFAPHISFYAPIRTLRARYNEAMKLTIDLDREDDGRWIAEALELPGVMCYGQTREEAVSNTERLAIDVIADRIAHRELPSSALNVSFTIPDEQLASQ